MNSNKYTLDRFEGDYAVFLKYPNETESLLVQSSELNDKVKKGDIVNILIKEEKYKIEPLAEEVKRLMSIITQLLEQLKNRT